MIVWGGMLSIPYLGSTATVTTSTGGRYDPASDSWVPTSNGPVAHARDWHGAIWSGRK
jgi:hypothetical protein